MKKYVYPWKPQFYYMVQSGNIAHIRFLMVVHDSFKSLTR